MVAQGKSTVVPHVAESLPVGLTTISVTAVGKQPPALKSLLVPMPQMHALVVEFLWRSWHVTFVPVQSAMVVHGYFSARGIDAKQTR
jgi:hypothetical protein